MRFTKNYCKWNIAVACTVSLECSKKKERKRKRRKKILCVVSIVRDSQHIHRHLRTIGSINLIQHYFTENYSKWNVAVVRTVSLEFWKKKKKDEREKKINSVCRVAQSRRPTQTKTLKRNQYSNFFLFSFIFPLLFLRNTHS